MSLGFRCPHCNGNGICLQSGQTPVWRTSALEYSSLIIFQDENSDLRQSWDLSFLCKLLYFHCAKINYLGEDMLCLCRESVELHSLCKHSLPAATRRIDQAFDCSFFALTKLSTESSYKAEKAAKLKQRSATCMGDYCSPYNDTHPHLYWRAQPPNNNL